MNWFHSKLNFQDACDNIEKSRKTFEIISKTIEHESRYNPLIIDHNNYLNTLHNALTSLEDLKEDNFFKDSYYQIEKLLEITEELLHKITNKQLISGRQINDAIIESSLNSKIKTLQTTLNEHSKLITEYNSWCIEVKTSLDKIIEILRYQYNESLRQSHGKYEKMVSVVKTHSNILYKLLEQGENDFVKHLKLSVKCKVLKQRITVFNQIGENENLRSVIDVIYHFLRLLPILGYVIDEKDSSNIFEINGQKILDRLIA